jgi:formylglycine-generating enzyme required for sulfatase activity/serine/threonine protein kinase
LQSLLASGGLGQVWLAVDSELDRPVAVKELKPEQANQCRAQARFWREARITGILEHPGVPPVYGLGIDGQGRPYYAMRLIKGETLEQAIARFHNLGGSSGASAVASRSQHAAATTVSGKGHEHAQSTPPAAATRTLALRELVSRLIDVCHTIEFAHSRGYVHRDIKPANIMLGEYGETIVVDWGLARPIAGHDRHETDPSQPAHDPSNSAEHTPTRMGVALGTPQFMSPEQAAGAHDQVGPASDVYSLGATLYMLLTGVPPFHLRHLSDILAAVVTGRLVPPRRVNPSAPAALEAVCLKTMALPPERRYASARSLADDLKRWLADEPVTAWREPWSHRLWRRVRRHRRTSMALAAVLFAATCVSIVFCCAIHRARVAADRAHLERTWAQLAALRSAAPQAVPHLLHGMQPSREQWEPAVRDLLRSSRLAPSERIHLSLAMLPRHPGTVRWLARQMLTCPEEDEFLLVRAALQPYSEQLLPALWKLLDDRRAPLAARTRAARCLALFDTNSTRWQAPHLQLLAQSVAQSKTEHLSTLREELRPLAHSLFEPVLKLSEQPGLPSTSRRTLWAVLLAWAAPHPKLAARLLCQAEPEDFDALLGCTPQATRDELCQQLGRALRASIPAASARQQIALARRQARAAAALLRLGQRQQLAALWNLHADRELESQFLALLRRYGVRPCHILALLEQTNCPASRRLCLLALGEFARTDLPPEQREQALNIVRSWYRRDPDSGVHGACGWLFHAWGLKHEALALEAQLVDQLPAPQQQWMVCLPAGVPVTLVLFSAGEFQMGSPLTESGRDWQEQPRRVRLTRGFWLCDRLVTRGEFAAFLHATQGEGPAQAYLQATAGYAGEDRAPAVMVSWEHAVAYCRWLTPWTACDVGQHHGPVTRSTNDVQLDATRGTYRLPTEAEWEYACRGGTITPYSFGRDRTLLPRYGWFDANAAGQDRAGRALRPNPRGVASMHGGALQWCQDWLGVPSQDSVVDPLGPSEGQYRVLRGGSYLSSASATRSAARTGLPPGFAGPVTGFRLAVTQP